MNQHLNKILFGILLIFNAEYVIAMSKIGFKVCIASEMKATVTNQGQPVIGATVVRKVQFNNTEHKTEVTTDENGNFILPALYERTLWKHSPFEVSAWSRVNIIHQNQEHLGVDVVKRNFDENGEVNNFEKVKQGMREFVPYEFTCELSNEESSRELSSNGRPISGKCLLTEEAQR